MHWARPAIGRYNFYGGIAKRRATGSMDIIRSATTNNDTYHLQRVKKVIDYLLSTQDEDGYIGIYDRDLRYKFDNENG